MSLVCALKWSELVISFSFRRRTNERLIKFKPNKQTRTCYAPQLRFMLNRAPKLTARKFYAPLNERSSFDGLWKAARLIGKNVRRRQLTISAKLHRKPVLAEGWRLSLSVFPLKRAPHAKWNNEIGKTESFYFSLT